MSVPHSTEHHCVAHKEALADGSAYQSTAYFVELENVIKAIYSHFSHSSVKIANLKSLFGVLEQKYIKVEKVNDSSPISVSLKKSLLSFFYTQLNLNRLYIATLQAPILTENDHLQGEITILNEGLEYQQGSFTLSGNQAGHFV